MTAPSRSVALAIAFQSSIIDGNWWCRRGSYAKAAANPEITRQIAVSRRAAIATFYQGDAHTARSLIARLPRTGVADCG